MSACAPEILRRWQLVHKPHGRDILPHQLLPPGQWLCPVFLILLVYNTGFSVLLLSQYFSNHYIFQDTTATFPGPVPSGYSTLQARHASKFSYHSGPQHPALAPHKIPPPSGFSQGGARHRNMGHLGTLPRPQPGEFSRSASEKEYLMPGPGYHGGVTSGAGPESNI